MKKKLKKRNGGFTPNARSKIFVSFQTYHGIKIAVRYLKGRKKCENKRVWNELVWITPLKKVKSVQNWLVRIGNIGGKCGIN